MFTETELEQIRLAKKKTHGGKLLNMACVFILIVLFFAMATHQISAKNFAYLALALVVISLAQPQLGHGPKYKDLVELLEKKAIDN